jgi:phosphohistidine swiveling domain-containing protein
MKKASELISKQPGITTNSAILARVTPDNAHVIVSLTKQRAYLMVGDEIAIDSPISSGKRGHTSPSGSFSVLEKDKDHRSNI